MRVSATRLLLFATLIALLPAAAAQTCPNPPGDCPNALARLITSGHYDAGIQFTIENESVKGSVQVDLGNGPVQGDVVVHNGDTGAVTFNVSSFFGNASRSVPVRVMVNPHVDGLKWTGATDASFVVSDNDTTEKSARFPFLVTASKSRAGPLDTPFYVILRDGQGSAVRADGTYPLKVGKTQPIPGLPIGAVTLLLVAVAAAGRKRSA